MPSQIIRNADQLPALMSQLSKRKMPITLSWVAGADRTGEQNAVQWMWAGEVAMQLGGVEPSDVQAEWKLTIGVPIMRADDVSFRTLYDSAIKPLDYETKIALMKAGYPVTSKMKLPQMIRFMDSVERTCRNAGLQITQPDPDLRKYHDRYREKVAA